MVVGLLTGSTTAAFASEWETSGAVVKLSTPTNNVVIQSTLTVQGGNFSVAGTTLIVTGGNVGLNLAAPSYLLDMHTRFDGEVPIHIRSAGFYPIGILFDHGTSFLGVGADGGGNFVVSQNWSSTSLGTVRFSVMGSGGYTRVGGGYASMNQFEVLGNAAFGSFPGTAGPTDGLIVSGKVGAGTANPATNLDVEGNAQFGSGTSKSTFTATPGSATYALQLSSGITIANGGPVDLTTGGFIRFADGSISTTAAVGGGGGGSGDMTTSGSNNVTGTIAMTSQSSFTVNIPARSSGSFSLNQITQKGLISGFVVFASTGGVVSIQNSLNVSSITRISTGYYAVHWAQQMATTEYPCSGMATSDPGNLGNSVVVQSQTAGDLVIRRSEYRFRTYYTAADAVNSPERVTLLCFGGAEAAGRQ